MLPLAASKREAGPAPARLQLRRLAELSADENRAWAELGAADPQAGPFAQPWFLAPSLEFCDREREARLAVICDHSGRWLGCAPVRTAWQYGRIPFPHWEIWRHPNMFGPAHLVRPGHEHIVWATLLAGLESAAPSRAALRLHDLPTDQAATAALLDLCRSQDRPCKFDRVRSRAVLMAPGDCAGPPAGEPGSARRRYAALERNLIAAAGPLDFAVHRAPAEVHGLAEQFIVLEQAGWKGRAGSAIASNPGNLAFFRTMIAAASQHGLIEIAALRSPRQIVAMSLHFVGNGGWGHGFKTTFDENFADCAPGVLLLRRLSDHLRDTGHLPFDSCSAADQQPISKLWPERRELFDCGIALGGTAGRSAFQLLATVEQLAHRHKARFASKA